MRAVRAGSDKLAKIADKATTTVYESRLGAEPIYIRVNARRRAEVQTHASA